MYPGSIKPGEFIGAIRCLLASPDLGRTNPPTLSGSWIDMPS